MNKVELTVFEYAALQHEREPWRRHLGTPVMDKLRSGGVDPDSINLCVEVEYGTCFLFIKE